MKIPKQVGIMTLPNAVLFPGTLLPLYIFEERYRRMLAEALEGDRIFAVGLSQANHDSAGESQPCTVAGVGFIRTSMQNADGTSHLVLQGLARVRIREFFPNHPPGDYPVAVIETVASSGEATESHREPVFGAVRKLARARARLGIKIPAQVVDSLSDLESAALFADVVSATFLESCQAKQQMLETLDVNERLARLEELLEQQIDQFQLWKKLQGKLGNKHVGNN